MPTRSQRFCAHTGCPELTDARYCPEHAIEAEEPRVSKQQRYSKARGTAASQGYDYDYQKVRAIKLSRDPLCERCLKKGLTVAATMTHHKKSVKEYPKLRLDINNLESLCNPCHEKIEGPNRWKKRESV